MEVTSVTIQCAPFDGQKPGTSGLRKPTRTFMLEHYTETFVQSLLTALGSDLAGATLVLGGDGRFYCEEAATKILGLCSANGVGRVIVGQNGFFSTPAVSCVIRKFKATGGIILSASHNPGGIDADFGIKYNVANGGPAPAGVTDEIYRISKELTQYSIATGVKVDLGKVGRNQFVVDGRDFVVDVIDSIDDYAQLMRELFDFDQLRALMSGDAPLRVLVNALYGAVGPYAQRILVEEMGMKAEDAVKCNPLPDFGGGHPDPNLTYAAELMEAMKAGDIDIGLEIFEVPTGWKYFGNLMDAGRLSLCGEESFGTGSDHIREKDGLWALLAWLSIIARRKLSVEAILKKHWETYGRNIFTRYDYENCASDAANAMMTSLEVFINKPDTVGTEIESEGRTFKVTIADNFSYVDPVDGSLTQKQGIRVIFQDGSRFVYRLSGTGSSGATIRLYADAYEDDPARMMRDAQDLLRPLVKLALDVAQLEKFTGRTIPTVIT